MKSAFRKYQIGSRAIAICGLAGRTRATAGSSECGRAVALPYLREGRGSPLGSI